MGLIIVDAHCDTIPELMKTKQRLNKNNLHVDISRMKSIGGYLQFFAIFIDIKKIKFSPIVHTLQMIDKMHQELHKNSSSIEIVYKFEDISRIIESQKCAALLSIEGGELCEGDLSVLRMLHRLGVRCMTLTWNYDNQIGCGVATEKDIGLSKFGSEVIKEMNKLGMLIDISHSSEVTFWDAARHSTHPIIASHSNAKKNCNHPRNLNDDQIKEIARKGGVIGINFNPDFLNDAGEASIDDILRQIDYIASVVGTSFIGIGSDFDGIDKVPKDCTNISDIENIFERLSKLNYTQAQIEDIAGKNFLRVIKNVIG